MSLRASVLCWLAGAGLALVAAQSWQPWPDLPGPVAYATVLQTAGALFLAGGEDGTRHRSSGLAIATIDGGRRGDARRPR